MGFNALSAPGEAHALVRFCLNAHAANINPERAGNIFAHFIDIRRHFRLLNNDCRIDVENGKALAFQNVVCCLEQRKA